MCPKHVGLCSHQGVRCCPVWECAFSRQPVPGGRKNPQEPHPQGISSWSARLPRTTKSLHLCLLHILLSTFSKQKRGNDVFTEWTLPKWHLTLSRQLPKESLFRDLYCILGGERKRVFEKSHCDFTNVFCNSPPHPSPRHTLRHTSGLNLLLAYFYSQIFKHVYHEALGIMLNTSSVNQNWERSMSRLYIVTLLI